MPITIERNTVVPEGWYLLTDHETGYVYPRYITKIGVFSMKKPKMVVDTSFYGPLSQFEGFSLIGLTFKD